MTVIQQTTSLEQLRDRAAITDVLSRYFLGLDRELPETVSSCFTEDVRAKYDERPPVVGRDALMGSLRVWRETAEGKIKRTTHFMGTLNFHRLHDDMAETETYAIAFLVETAGGDHVNMRSLRYVDRFRRTPEGWRICERRHTLDWSCMIPATFTTVAASFMTKAVKVE